MKHSLFLIAYAFSQKTKDRQMASFKDWGILADWKNSYYTCNPDYIIQQLNVFQQLYEKVSIVIVHLKLCLFNFVIMAFSNE